MPQLLVTLVIPCRNEERYLRQCLESILANDYPKDRLEILIVDGMSEDQTRSIIHEYLARFPEIRLMDNPKRSVCAAMNLGMSQAAGDIIFKMDAHSLYEKNYISACVEALETTGADNVGGKFVMVPGADTAMAKAIAIAMSHWFGIGQYYQWMHTLDKPTEVDTVSFGCFKKEMLAEKGLFFNEALSRGSDSEFNKRLREKGGKIILLPETLFQYFARPNLKALWKHQASCSYWVVYWTRFGCKFTFRAMLPMFFVLGLTILFTLAFFSSIFLFLFLTLIACYEAVTLYVSRLVAIKEKDWRMFFLMPLAFGTIHISRGFGALAGVWGRYADQ